MVKAILTGRKTMTRRIMKPQPGKFAGGCHPNNKPIRQAPYIDAYCGEKKTESNPIGMGTDWHWWTEDNRLGPFVAKCPFGVPGDRLWVRETFYPAFRRTDANSGCVFPHESGGLEAANKGWKPASGWKPSIHMPRWASRITLEITGVKVERLQDIDDCGVVDEGVDDPSWHKSYGNSDGDFIEPEGVAVDAFAELWDDLYGKQHPWKSNPFVWCYSFKVVNT